MGSNQLDYLREQVKHDRVWFVPHGVDTDYFVPPEREAYDVTACVLDITCEISIF